MTKQGWLHGLIVLALCVVACMAIDRTMLRTYFGCPPCDLTKCHVPENCQGELVKESGACGCCLTCARIEGEECGVFTERCAPGLKCEPVGVARRADKVWSAFFKGKGVCVPEGILLHFYL